MQKIVAWKWSMRFLKFSILGLPVFVVSTIIYFELFDLIGSTWSYLISALSGGISHFVLVGILNRTKKGEMFDDSKNS